MRLLGIDYGEKRVGVAITDELNILAHPLKVVKSTNAINEIKKILNEYNDISKIIVGMPLNLKGEVSFKAKQVLDWIEKLKKEVNIPIITWDERFTTSAAESFLLEANVKRKNRKKIIDKLAARIILQDYLDANK
ncbi:MAG: Holliday junction resolvase RuvX [Candidatus Firestonebacteria bacterium]